MTKWSWLRSSRRSSADSLTISVRAVSGWERMSDEIECQRVEEEMRVDLTGERLEPGRHQQLLLLVQLVLDAGAVPDLDRDRHGRAPSPARPARHPRRAGAKVEQAVRDRTASRGTAAAARAAIGRGDQDDLPVDLEPAQESPRIAVQAGEDERREVPDRLLRAHLTQAAAGKAAADRERQRRCLARDDSREADQTPRRCAPA